MCNTEKIRALVIGSGNHLLASNCINWGGDFYVGDYELLIFNTLSLTTEKITEIIKDKKDYFTNIKKQIVEAQAKKNLRVICIMNKFLKPDYYEPEVDINNYAWCPIIPIFEENGGKIIPSQKFGLEIEYLNKVDGWDVLFDEYFNNTGYKEGNDWNYKFKITKESYLQNNLGRDIAFGLSWSITVRNEKERWSKYPIIFLPKINDLSSGIDSILNNFILIEEPQPSWINEVIVSGDKKIMADINTNDEKIEELKKNNEDLSQKLAEVNRFKKLLYLSGKPLEEIVNDALSLLGVDLKKLEVENLEDRIFEYDGFSIPFEIRGKETKGLNEKDLSQLIKRIADRERGEKYKARGVFVINHYRNFKPENREDVCHPNIIEQAVVFKICIISTLDIFNLINRVLNGESIDFKDVLFNTVGLFDFA